MAEEQCNTEQFVRTCLTRLESVGLAMIAESGAISFVALIVLFILIIRNILRHRRYLPRSQVRLIRTPADAYVLSLFVADLLQSIGGAMDIKWVNRGYVQIGHYCTAEGLIQELGETAVAFATGVIAIHTFVVVWLRKGGNNLKIAFLVIACTWLYVILYVTIAVTTKHNFYSPDPLWCWIGDQYLKDKISGEYAWLWTTLVISFIVYLPLFLWIRGIISVHEEYWWKVTWHWRTISKDHVDRNVRGRPSAPSLALLAYPVAYTIVVLPVSVVRWIKFTGHDIPDAATFFALFLHRSFGAVNVLLILTTRPSLLLFVDPRTLKSDCELGIAQTNQSLDTLSDDRSNASIRTAEELQHDNTHDGESGLVG